MGLCRSVHNAQTPKPIPIGLCANLSVSKSVSVSAFRCSAVSTNRKRKIKQECIPVGCVPPAAVVVCWGVSASVHAGIPPACGPGDPPWVWACWRPPRPDPSTSPPGCGPGDLQCMLGYHPPPWTDRHL